MVHIRVVNDSNYLASQGRNKSWLFLPQRKDAINKIKEDSRI